MFDEHLWVKIELTGPVFRDRILLMLVWKKIICTLKRLLLTIEESKYEG